MRRDGRDSLLLMALKLNDGSAENITFNVHGACKGVSNKRHHCVPHKQNTVYVYTFAKFLKYLSNPLRLS